MEQPKGHSLHAELLRSLRDMAGSAAIDVMVQGLAFLGAHGFTLCRAEESHSEASGRICAVEYVAESCRRSVAVTYFADRPSARASISRTDEEFTFADAGSMAVREPVFADVPGEGLERLVSYLGGLRGQLEGAYLAVLKGGVFENDGFDWSPYK